MFVVISIFHLLFNVYISLQLSNFLKINTVEKIIQLNLIALIPSYSVCCCLYFSFVFQCLRFFAIKNFQNKKLICTIMHALTKEWSIRAHYILMDKRIQVKMCPCRASFFFHNLVLCQVSSIHIHLTSKFIHEAPFIQHKRSNHTV